MGYFKTALLMAAMTALFMGLGYLLAGTGGMMIALVVAGAMNAFTWWNSDKMVLRTYNAQPVGPNDPLGLSALVAGLVRNAGLPMPAVYLIDAPPAQCLCHRAQSAQRGGRGDHRAGTEPVARGTGRGHRA